MLIWAYLFAVCVGGGGIVLNLVKHIAYKTAGIGFKNPPRALSKPKRIFNLCQRSTNYFHQFSKPG